MAAHEEPGRGSRPRIGVPWRSLAEEVAGRWDKLAPYLEAVEAAGGEAVPISLQTSPEDLAQLARDLDGFVLPGSAADVDPARYHAERGSRTAAADAARERTDDALLDSAFARHKPLLAICYGAQMLNVRCRGTLVQDIPSEIAAPLEHPWTGREQGRPEPHHDVRIVPGSLLERLAGTLEVEINSSHHQSVREPGKGLRVAARASDGVVEAVEWTGGDWILGVQWHPERQWPQASSPASPEAVALARGLFEGLVRAAQAAEVEPLPRRSSFDFRSPVDAIGVLKPGRRAKSGLP
jgi:putative glutamine amidotransferase